MKPPILRKVCPICGSEKGLIVLEARHDPLHSSLVLKMNCPDGCGGGIEYRITRRELTYDFLGKIDSGEE